MELLVAEELEDPARILVAALLAAVLLVGAFVVLDAVLPCRAGPLGAAAEERVLVVLLLRVERAHGDATRPAGGRERQGDELLEGLATLLRRELELVRQRVQRALGPALLVAQAAAADPPVAALGRGDRVRDLHGRGGRVEDRDLVRRARLAALRDRGPEGARDAPCLRVGRADTTRLAERDPQRARDRRDREERIGDACLLRDPVRGVLLEVLRLLLACEPLRPGLVVGVRDAAADAAADHPGLA